VGPFLRTSEHQRHDATIRLGRIGSNTAFPPRPFDLLGYSIRKCDSMLTLKRQPQTGNQQPFE
jgi:hypothetical protein